MARTGAPGDAIELVVVDDYGCVVVRPTLIGPRFPSRPPEVPVAPASIYRNLPRRNHDEDRFSRLRLLRASRTRVDHIGMRTPVEASNPPIAQTNHPPVTLV